MFEILAQFVRPSDDFSFVNPLFQVFDIVTQFVELEDLAELLTTFKSQVLQTGVEFVNLRLFYSNCIAAAQTNSQF